MFLSFWLIKKQNWSNLGERYSFQIFFQYANLAFPKGVGERQRERYAAKFNRHIVQYCAHLPLFWTKVGTEYLPWSELYILTGIIVLRAIPYAFAQSFWCNISNTRKRIWLGYQTPNSAECFSSVHISIKRSSISMSKFASVNVELNKSAYHI